MDGVAGCNLVGEELTGFNLALEILLMDGSVMYFGSTSCMLFQSRTRDSFDGRGNGVSVMAVQDAFQSRTRDSFDGR